MTDSFIDTFQQLKTILCICPHCRSMLRLSDLNLRDKRKAPTTFLDEYELKGKKIDKEDEKIVGSNYFWLGESGMSDYRYNFS